MFCSTAPRRNLVSLGMWLCLAIAAAATVCFHVLHIQSFPLKITALFLSVKLFESHVNEFVKIVKGDYLCTRVSFHTPNTLSSSHCYSFHFFDDVNCDYLRFIFSSPVTISIFFFRNFWEIWMIQMGYNSKCRTLSSFPTVQQKILRLGTHQLFAIFLGWNVL